jgi:hypothetical protein
VNPVIVPVDPNDIPTLVLRRMHPDLFVGQEVVAYVDDPVDPADDIYRPAKVTEVTERLVYLEVDWHGQH